MTILHYSSGASLVGLFDNTYANIPASTTVQGAIGDIDSAIGNRTYTEDNYVTDSQSLTASVNALDMMLQNVATGTTGLWLDTGAFIYPSNYTSFAITDTGRLGIGTTAPATALEVVGEARATRYAFQDDSDTYIDTLSGNEILFVSNGANQALINANGNLGIGTTNPGFLLEVNGSARINGNTTIGDGSSDTLTLNSGVLSTASTTTLDLINSQVRALNVESGLLNFDTSNSRLGVGTTAPAYKLDVNGDVRVAVGSDFYVNTIGLNDSGSTSSGASLVGLYDNSYANISGNTTVQGAIGAFDLAIGNRTYTNDYLLADAQSITTSLDTIDTAVGNRTYTNDFLLTDAQSLTASLDAIDTAFGNRTYTQDNYVADAQSLTASIDALDIAVASLNTGESGIWRDAGSLIYPSNAISFAITDTGRLGIGTTNPATELEVVGNITLGEDNWIGIGTVSERLVFDADGNDVEVLGANVGIGTTNPLQILDVAGNLVVGTDATNNDDYIYFDDGSTESLMWDDAPGEFALSDDLDILGHLAIGADASVGTTALLKLDESFTSDADQYGIMLQPDFSFTAGASRNLYGVYLNANINSVNEDGNAGIYNGIYNTVSVSAASDMTSVIGTSTIIDSVTEFTTGALTGNYTYINHHPASASTTDVVGDDINIQSESSGTILNAYGSRAIITEASGGVINTGYGYRAECNDAGTCYAFYAEADDPQSTTNYGLFIEANSGTANNYGIYALDGDWVLDNDGNGIAGGTGAGGDIIIGEGQDLELYHNGTNSYILNNTGDLYITDAGSDDVILSSNGGNVGIGNSTPTYKLDVNGDIRVAAGSDYYLGTTGLNDNSSLTSGASLVGLFDSTYANIAANTTVQTAIGELDSAVGTRTYTNDYVVVDGQALASSVNAIDSAIGNRTYTEDNYVTDAQTLAASINSIDMMLQNVAVGSTGVWLDSANFVFAHNATNVVVTDTGRLGIGTTAPATSLEVVGEIRGTRFAFQDDTDTYMDTLGANELRFVTNATIKALINSSGNLGIGTTAPIAALQVAGDVYTTEDNTYDLGSSTLRWQDAYLGTSLHLGLDGDDASMFYNVDDNVLAFNLDADADAEVGFNSSGSLGIGTTDPSSAIHIISTDTTNGIFRMAYDDSNYTKFTVTASGAMTINDSGSDVVTFDSTGADFNVNANFGGSTGVTIENDLQFTNATDAYIKSSSPLYIETTTDDDNLTLITHGTGDIILNLGIGTTNANALLPGVDDLHDLGSSGARWDDIYATNGVIQTSDERLKNNIENMQYGLDELLQMRPVTFNWISEPNGDTKLGLIAQEVQNVIPEVVIDESYMGIRYADLVPVLIKGAQDQYNEVVSIEDTLSSEIDEIRDLMELHGIVESTQSILASQEGLFTQMTALYEEFKSFAGSLSLSAGKDAEGNDLLTVNSDLVVLGETTLGDVNITGNLMAGLIKIDTLANSIDILGPACYNKETGEIDGDLCADQTLYLQKSLAGNIDLFDGVVTIQPDGLLDVKGEIRAEKYAVSTKETSKASAGKNVILAGNTSIEVTTDALNDNSLIFVTPNKPVLVGSKKTGDNTFEITLVENQDNDIEVSWWIVDSYDNVSSTLPINDEDSPDTDADAIVSNKINGDTAEDSQPEVDTITDSGTSEPSTL